MPLMRCPDCGREVSDKAAVCPQCAYPLRGNASVASRTGIRVVNYKCPACRGTGRFRNGGYLPWNNLAAIVFLVGVAAVVTATCLHEGGTEFFFGGAVMSGVGLAMWLAGDVCSRCHGTGKLQRFEHAPRRQTQQSDYITVGVSSAQSRSNAARPARPPSTRKDRRRR